MKLGDYMEIKAFMKKSYLFFMLVIGAILLTASILLSNATLILAASLILAVVIWMLIVYINKPAFTVTKQRIIFQGLFSKTEYLIKDIEHITYTNTNHKKISLQVRGVETETFIQNSYNITIEDIMVAIKYNKNQGENNDTSFTENN